MPMTISLTTCYTPRPFKANDKQTPLARHEVHCNKHHLRSEMHVVSKIASLTKFCQIERLFMDLTILANFSEIRQSEINSADLAI